MAFRDKILKAFVCIYTHTPHEMLENKTTHIAKEWTERNWACRLPITQRSKDVLLAPWGEMVDSGCSFLGESKGAKEGSLLLSRQGPDSPPEVTAWALTGRDSPHRHHPCVLAADVLVTQDQAAGEGARWTHRTGPCEFQLPGQRTYIWTERMLEISCAQNKHLELNFLKTNKLNF